MGKRLLPAAILLLSLLPGCAQKQVVTGDFSLVSPLPREIASVDTTPFAIRPGTVICTSGNDSLLAASVMLADYIETATGLELRISPKRAGRNHIALEVDPSVGEGLDGFRKGECYRIVSSAGGVTITGGSVAGVVHGIQTFYKALPLAEVPETVSVALPAGTVLDYPEFPYRSFMLDCGRHFFPVAYIKQLIDILALHNLDYFHWHLTEDQGWRIEIKKYPRLTEIGSYRPGTRDPQDRLDGVPVEGFYTQDEAREIVRYAAERGITVIPEIDMPGHTQAALAAYPSLGCTGGPYEVSTRYGVLEDVLCVGKDATIDFVKDVLEELLDIFPSEYIHLGGDECPKVRWENCPDCQRRIRELGLKADGSKTAEELLQSWFTSQIEAFLAERGRRMICWNDVLCDWDDQVTGEPSKRTVIAGWMRPESAAVAAMEGYDAITCPISNLYFSNAGINRISGIESIERVYGLSVIPEGLSQDQARHIIGAEACIWTERVADTEDLEWKLLPRLSALSEIQWTDPATRDLDAYLPRLSHMAGIYDARGWGFREDILP